MSDPLVILSRNIFDATSDASFDGFVAVEDGEIVATGPRGFALPYTSHASRVIDVEDKLVMPGLTDTHTFFSGWVLDSLGCNLARIKTAAEGIDCLTQWAHMIPENQVIFGHGWNPALELHSKACLLDEAFPSRPVVAFSRGRGTCWMNEVAQERYLFTPDACWSEMIWRMMPEYLSLPEMSELYINYQHMLNARGVTQIKEMAFDDYYGFIDVMEELAHKERLTARVSLMSQPVGAGINLAYGRALREHLTDGFLGFSGYNRMTDRGVADGLAEYIDPYTSSPSECVKVPVEWELIERETLAADAADFRYSLHCQGDGAVRHAIELFNRCKKDASGHLVNRHAITDNECTSPGDLECFGVMGGICEVYAQIQILDSVEDIRQMALHQIGPERFAYFWNRRKMQDSGIKICCATDLPLLIPHLGESIYCACGGYFNDGGQANVANTLTIPELLRAWTVGGAYDCYSEQLVGTLEAGKRADLIVAEADLLHLNPKVARNVGVALTLSDGRIVYENL